MSSPVDIICFLKEVDNFHLIPSEWNGFFYPFSSNLRTLFSSSKVTQYKEVSWAKAHYNRKSYLIGYWSTFASKKRIDTWLFLPFDVVLLLLHPDPLTAFHFLIAHCCSFICWIVIFSCSLFMFVQLLCLNRSCSEEGNQIFFSKGIRSWK